MKQGGLWTNSKGIHHERTKEGLNKKSFKDRFGFNLSSKKKKLKKKLLKVIAGPQLQLLDFNICFEIRIVSHVSFFK